MSVIGYLDPGTGGMIVASAAAGLAGVGVAAKSMWRKQASRFRKSPDTDAAPEADEVEPSVEQFADDS